MSKILDLDEVDTSQLSEGLEVKNYRALCELVGEEPKTGNGKKAQLKEWERFFAMEKVKGSLLRLIRGMILLKRKAFRFPRIT